MALGSVHYAKPKVKNTSICGVTHEKVRLSENIKNVTCPQCKRLWMDDYSGSEVNRNRRNRKLKSS